MKLPPERPKGGPRKLVPASRPFVHADEKTPVRQLKRRVNELEGLLVTLRHQFGELQGVIASLIRSRQDAYLSGSMAVALSRALINRGVITEPDVDAALAELQGDQNEPETEERVAPPGQESGAVSGSGAAPPLLADQLEDPQQEPSS